MRLASGTVLGLAAVASSPALWQGLVTRQLPVDLALTRYLVAVVAVWIGLSLLALLVGAPAAPLPDPVPEPQAPDGAPAPESPGSVRADAV